MPKTIRTRSKPTKFEIELPRGQKLLQIPLAILAWFGVAAVVVWSFSHISRSLLILAAGLFVAYLVSPFIKRLEKYMPKPLAILLVYLVLFITSSIFTFFVAQTAVVQLLTLIHANQKFLTSEHVQASLSQLNIPAEQLKQVELQIASLAEKLSASILPFISSIFTFILDLLIVIILSIYMLLDGSRILRSIDRNTPAQYKQNIRFLRETLNSVIGGYIRGQFSLSLIIGLIITVGMFVFQVPYAILLGVLAFFLSFIPILGVFISGVICVLLALSKGWALATVVLIYFIIAHIIEGDILGPKIVGKALGLHPIVSILALVIGTELFGVPGALFASPVAGVVQVVLGSFWLVWRKSHTKDFVYKI